MYEITYNCASDPVCPDIITPVAEERDVCHGDNVPLADISALIGIGDPDNTLGEVKWYLDAGYTLEYEKPNFIFFGSEPCGITDVTVYAAPSLVIWIQLF